MDDAHPTGIPVKGRKGKMKEPVIISGKGGTGKTTLISAFASMAKNNMLCDADVDTSAHHQITDPEIQERHLFQSGHTGSKETGAE